jgi:hypothetical protein
MASNLLEILLRVPQGSVLDPLLFLTCINDLTMCSKLYSYSFVDDTTFLACKPDILLMSIFPLLTKNSEKLFLTRRTVWFYTWKKQVFALFNWDSNIIIYFDNKNLKTSHSFIMLTLKKQ